MFNDRKTAARLFVVFGISAVSYAVAGIAATHARDHLLARAEMLHELRYQATGSVPATRLVTATVVAGP